MAAPLILLAGVAVRAATPTILKMLKKLGGKMIAKPSSEQLKQAAKGMPDKIKTKLRDEAKRNPPDKVKRTPTGAGQLSQKAKDLQPGKLQPGNQRQKARLKLESFKDVAKTGMKKGGVVASKGLGKKTK